MTLSNRVEGLLFVTFAAKERSKKRERKSNFKKEPCLYKDKLTESKL